MQTQIFNSLRKIGLRGEFLKEMNDHFCSSYEEQLQNGLSSEQAFLAIQTRIQSSALHKTQRTLFIINHKNKIVMTSAIILLSIFTFFTQNSNSSISEVNQYISEVGIDSLIFGKVVNGSPEVTSHFGMRYNPLQKKKVMHKGIDLKGKIGDPVYLPADGIVSATGYHAKRGHFIEINHAQGYTSRYFHLSKILVKKDSALLKGVQIGEIGNSGLSIAPHLHFEILKQEMPLDPKDYLRV